MLRKNKFLLGKEMDNSMYPLSETEIIKLAEKSHLKNLRLKVLNNPISNVTMALENP